MFAHPREQKCHKIQSDVYGEETEKREREKTVDFTHDIELYYWIVFLTQRRAALERIARREHSAPRAVSNGFTRRDDGER